MTQNFSSVYQFHKTGSGQFLPPRQVNLSPGLAKIALPINRDRLWCLARRDSFSAKAPGLMAGVTAPPTLTAPTRRRYNNKKSHNSFETESNIKSQLDQSGRSPD